ncbi:MAG: hypothetical protein O7F08_07245 [Deltaproteobacteria bacterium]|nr:hypothetical protein [Deltaproteobacteria bacterium]
MRARSSLPADVPEGRHVLGHARFVEVSVCELRKNRVDRVPEGIGKGRTPSVTLGAVDEVGWHQTAHSTAVANRGRGLHAGIEERRSCDDLEHRGGGRRGIRDDVDTVALPGFIAHIRKHAPGSRLNRNQSSRRDVVLPEEVSNVGLQVVVDRKHRARPVTS